MHSSLNLGSESFNIGVIFLPNTLEDHLFSWAFQGSLKKQDFAPFVIRGSLVRWRLPLVDIWLVAGVSSNLL